MSRGARVLEVGLIVLLHPFFLQVGNAIFILENPICYFTNSLYLEDRVSIGYSSNCASSCGSIRNICYPFRLKGDPSSCGDPNYELGCENNRTILSLFSGKYYVEEITYDYSYTIRVVDAGLEKGNCFSTPRYSLTSYNFTSPDPYYLITSPSNLNVSFANCEKPINSAYIAEIIPCDINGSSSVPTYTYALAGVKTVKDVPSSCSIRVSVVTQFANVTMHNLQNVLSTGVVLSFRCFERRLYELGRCELFVDEIRIVPWFYHPTTNVLNRGFGQLYKILRLERLYWILYDEYIYYYPAFYTHTNYKYSAALCYFILGAIPIVLVIAARALCGLLCLLAFLIYKWRRRHLSMDDTVEEFLQSHNNLMPIRYSYSDIRKMTKGFKDKLGEGGYGSVYKGKLRSGHLVAVKMLGKSKSKGQDFINEVATIGRIHHVNVVQLVGFCSEGSKRALVYEFMTNGSLDRFIFSESEKGISLSWERTYEIALRVAQGIEYLHQGCDIQILHFDIKPHNILLDENFIPKVSDFGLAKLYPVDDNIVSLTAARGTLGYIAPELIYKNIGGVSYKADVYSFGKLLMEMAGRRKNLNANAEHLSQIYFPSWIYDRLNGGEDMEMEDATEDEKKIARKMILVALWCIQLKPADRPSMRKVVEMLEGEVESLQMPPELLLYPQDPPIREQMTTGSAESATSLCTSIDSIALDVNVD